MRADELHVDVLRLVGNGDNQSVVVTFDVENDAVVGNHAGVGVLFFTSCGEVHLAALASANQALKGPSAAFPLGSCQNLSKFRKATMCIDEA